jgi:hypothetical protein
MAGRKPQIQHPTIGTNFGNSAKKAEKGLDKEQMFVYNRLEQMS